MPKGFDIKVKGLKALSANLQQYDRKVQRRWSRGAVGEGLNRIRDQAKENALSVGLGKSGAAVTPSGHKIERRGLIPDAIDAYVLKRSRPGFTIGGVRVASGRRGPTQTYHWRYIEFGSIHNAPRPFFRPALYQTTRQAIDAAVEVLQRQTRNANKWAGAA